MKRSFWISIWIGGLVTAAFIALVLKSPRSYRIAERKLLDWRFELRGRIPVDPRLVHIDIDDASIEQLGRWPWSRDRFAAVIRVLKDLNVRAVIFDVEFPDKSPLKIDQKKIRGPDTRLADVLQDPDAELAEALQVGPPVYLPFHFAASAADEQTRDQVVPPIRLLADQAAGLGFASARPDEEDGTLRKLQLARTVNGRTHWQIAFTFALDYLGVPREQVQFAAGRITLPAKPPLAIPVDADNNVWIVWPGVRGESFVRQFRHIGIDTICELPSLQRAIARNLAGSTAWQDLAGKLSKESNPERAAQLRRLMGQAERAYLQRLESLLERRPDAEVRKLHDALEEQIARRNELRKRLRHAICIIGATFTGNTDFHPTPLHQSYPGVMALSSLINMILTRNFLHTATPPVNVLLLIALGLGTSVFFARGRPKANVLALLVAFIGCFLFSLLLFRHAGYIVATAAPLGCTLVNFAAITAYRQLTEERRRRQIRHTFQHYMSPAVVEEVLQHPERLALGGEKRVLTAFFSDVAGFTAIAEKLSPTELVELLNEYLTPMTEIILSHGGVLDKYEGDLIMAFFGAPLEQSDHAARACFAALDNQKKLQALRPQLRRHDIERFDVRIGLNSGEMSVGNMGSTDRFDYTIMGDHVNLARRLEGANKFFRTRILISETTCQAAGDAILARPLGRIRVVGRREPVAVFELLARRAEASAEERKRVDLSAAALDAYYARQWAQAQERLQELETAFSSDALASIYLPLCRQYAQADPADDWDGAIEMTEK